MLFVDLFAVNIEELMISVERIECQEPL